MRFSGRGGGGCKQHTPLLKMKRSTHIAVLMGHSQQLRPLHLSLSLALACVLVGAEESGHSRDQIAVVDDTEVVLHPAVQLARENSVSDAWGSETVVAMAPQSKTRIV